ncbi:MAG: type I-B CRISPR-associated protein Cas5b [Segetibacter sp.]
MVNEKLISFDLKADFGFFKKPDYNDGLLLSYNMLHKPALLGILGAITGLAGYKKKGELPEYYLRLQDILIGIEPLGGEKGNFQKTAVKYTNTVGYANLDGNLLIEETMLVKPAYRCYLLLNLEDETQYRLFNYVNDGIAEYIPYLGKNEYQAWLDDTVMEYDFTKFSPSSEFVIESLFVREGTIKNKIVKPFYSFTISSMINQGSFFYFERLPIGFDEQLMQYQYNDFAYTDWTLKPDSKIENLFKLKKNNREIIVQLF